jgi:uncharacterized RmlC-like cupin family protein
MRIRGILVRRTLSQVPLPEMPMPEARIVKVRPDEALSTLQRLPYFVGVSGERTGATGLSMNLVVVPPGAASVPHCHLGFEAAIYQLEGRVRTLWGPRLAESVDTEAGDFLFIPPGMPHQAVNLSATERAVAVVARNAASEQESVVPYDPASDRPA